MKYAMEIIDREEIEEERKRKQAEKHLKNEPSYIQSLLEFNVVINIGLFLLILGLWMYFREDVYRYFFFNGSGNKNYRPL
jgi:hypothetical protein